MPAPLILAAASPAYAIAATQASTLTIDLDTTKLFEGAQLMIDALSSPYLLLAGLGLGVAILSAIMAAVRKVRM